MSVGRADGWVGKWMRGWMGRGMNWMLYISSYWPSRLFSVIKLSMSDDLGQLSHLFLSFIWLKFEIFNFSSFDSATSRVIWNSDNLTLIFLLTLCGFDVGFCKIVRTWFINLWWRPGVIYWGFTCFLTSLDNVTKHVMMKIFAKG